MTTAQIRAVLREAALALNAPLGAYDRTLPSRLWAAWDALGAGDVTGDVTGDVAGDVVHDDRRDNDRHAPRPL